MSFSCLQSAFPMFRKNRGEAELVGAVLVFGADPDTALAQAKTLMENLKTEKVHRGA